MEANSYNKMTQESLDESEIVSHLTAKGNDGNVYHYVASKNGASITNKSGVQVHPSAVLQKAKGNAAAEEIHKVISAKLQAGTPKGTADAINTLHKYSHFDWKSELTESLDEKTLTPNELTKREEIVKSLKKKQSEFVKRYGADRAKSVMYAVATKTAKEVTEETDKKYKVSYDFYGSNKHVPLYSKSHNVTAKTPDEAVDTLKKLVGGRNHKAEEIHESELTEAQLDEMGYGSARAADHEFARSGTAAPQKKAKFILKNKATGKVLSIHADAPSAVAARNKIGSFSTHSIIKEESLDEATDVRTDHSVGDTVYAKHPTEKSKTLTGVVTRVGRTTYELQHKDGSKAMYPHKEVSDNFEKLNPNPYKTKKQIQREHLELTGEFLSLDEIVLDERIEMPQGHKYSADPITKASSEGQGRKKPQMGSKANTAAVVAAILKKTKE